MIPNIYTVKETKKKYHNIHKNRQHRKTHLTMYITLRKKLRLKCTVKHITFHQRLFNRTILIQIKKLVMS